MPDLLTPEALATAGPLVLETLFKHFIGPKPTADKGKAREDLMYDEVFVLVKTFLEIATKHPVGALQNFGQVRTLSPPWVGVHRVTIPRSTLNDSATFLIKGFGGEERAYKIAGGTKWWQVRAGKGVEGEWIVMKKDWKEVVAEEKKEKKKRVGEGVEDGEVEDGEFRPEMNRLRCMLYIHGGAYYWGSINSHRYTIWRYARKMHGRCFAVNYRKAPQYPFPCAIQDCLAAYLYLTNPPPEAQHRPVDPKSIILAGDSAGGGLVLALLQILRDTEGLELPAGAVLISPWSDLTHSFPSILGNTATDIIPPYGFLHKPSSLWPPPPPMLTEEVQTRLRSRVREVVSKLHNHPEKAKEAHELLSKTMSDEISIINKPTTIPDKLKTSEPSAGLDKSKNQDESDLHPFSEQSNSENKSNQKPEPQNEPTNNPSRANPAELFETLVKPSKDEIRASTLAQCDTPLKLTVKSEEVLIDTQIQLYATNAQLCHPWISPVLGYMGGLPPLYILCGEQEVLRDEIQFLAHKAANPDAYPIREDVKAMLPSLQGIENRYSATNVHLQVYDGACHVLPLLSMTRAARGAFRAIASFARYVTPSAPGSRYISRSYPNTPGGSNLNSPRGSASKASSSNLHTGSQTPQHPGDQDNQNSANLATTAAHHKILENVMSTTPSVMSPHEGPSLTVRKGSKKTPILDLNLGDELTITESPRNTLIEPRQESSKDTLEVGEPHSTSQSGTPNRNVSFASSINSSTGDQPPEPVKRKSILPPTPRRVSTIDPGQAGDSGNASMTDDNAGTEGRRANSQPSGDDSGPRFKLELQQGENFLNDWNAKEGEAGWAGIYKGDDPFTNHMIRERVSTSGILRPLEPLEELQAFKMPFDEIGYIKEGPAMRYLNGQALWDKKYHRASKNVKKRREKNLKIAHKESGKLSMEWIKKAQEEMKKEENRLKEHHKDRKVKNDHDKKKKVDGEDEKEKEDDEDAQIDPSWNESWNWALNGEAPPPSAIVSRRDFTEARQLALMADRLDSTHNTSLHGLSIWVGLATFFTQSSGNEKQRNKAGQAIKVAREVQRLQNKSKSQSQSQSPNQEERGIWTDLDDDDDHDDGNATDDEIENQNIIIGKHGDLITKVTSKSSQQKGNSTKPKSKGKGKAVEGRKDRKKKGAIANLFEFWKKKN